MIKKKIEAEMLCYDGKIQKAIDFLTNNNLINEAIETLMILGKYEKAIKILKNPNYKKFHNNDKYNMDKLIKM